MGTIKSKQRMRILSLALLAVAVTARSHCGSTVTTVKSLPDGGFRRTITKVTDKIERKTIINYYADGAKDWDVKIQMLQQKEEDKPEEKPKKPEEKPKKPEEKPKKPETTPAKCTPKKTVGQCGMCQSSDQCAEGFCCPYMKKCVATSRTPC